MLVIEPKMALRVLKKADAFDIEPVIESLHDEVSISKERLREYWKELQKWLVASLVYPAEEFVMMGPVDLLWHKFVLHTRLYAEFCWSVLGDFVHHEPEPIGAKGFSNSFGARTFEKRIPPSKVKSYADTLARIEALFGEPINYTIWPAVKDIDQGIVISRVDCPQPLEGIAPQGCCGRVCGCHRDGRPPGRDH